MYAVVLPLLIGNTKDSGEGLVSFELVDKAGESNGEGWLEDVCTWELEPLTRCWLSFDELYEDGWDEGLEGDGDFLSRLIELLLRSKIACAVLISSIFRYCR